MLLMRGKTTRVAKALSRVVVKKAFGRTSVTSQPNSARTLISQDSTPRGGRTSGRAEYGSQEVSEGLICRTETRRPQARPRTNMVRPASAQSAEEGAISRLRERISAECPDRGYAPPLSQKVAFRSLPISDATLRGLEEGDGRSSSSSGGKGGVRAIRTPPEITAAEEDGTARGIRRGGTTCRTRRSSGT